MSAHVDLSLTKEVSTGSQEAFERFLDRYFDRVYAYVRRRSSTRPAAQLVTDHILEAAVELLPSYDGSVSLDRWVLAISKQVLAREGWDAVDVGAGRERRSA